MGRGENAVRGRISAGISSLLSDHSAAVFPEDKGTCFTNSKTFIANFPSYS